MALPKSIKFHGEVFDLTHSSYAALILPFVALKRFLQTLYRLVLGQLWSELLEGKTADASFTLIVFLIFCALSLLSYYCRAAIGVSFGLGCLLWFVDYQLAKAQFARGQRSLLTTLEGRGDWVVWQRQTSANATEHNKFQATAVAQISLIRTQVRGGAFQAVLGIGWQVYLTLWDRTELLVHETPDSTIAFAQANQLSHYFAVPVLVLNSEGLGRYAAEPLNLQGIAQRTQACSTIHCQKTLQQWHIYSQWRLSSSWRLFKQILRQFGFLLFAIIVANLMIQFGGLLHVLIFAWFNPQIVMQMSWLHAGLRWQTMLELGLALGMMIVQGARLSREEHIYITPDHLIFFLDTQKIDQLATPAIDSILFLKQPFPSVLILAGDQALELRGLQHETEFRIMVAQLHEAIVNLNHKIA